MRLASTVKERRRLGQRDLDARIARDRFGSDGLHGFVHDVRQSYGGNLELDAAVLELRDVEHVVDGGNQPLGIAQGDLEQVARVGRYVTGARRFVPATTNP